MLKKIYQLKTIIQCKNNGRDSKKANDENDDNNDGEDYGEDDV